MKLKDILNSQAVLQKLLQREDLGKFTFTLVYAMKAIEAPLSAYERTRTDLIKKYGEKDKDGNLSISPKSKAFEQFSKELEPLLDEEIKVSTSKLKMADLEKADLKVSAADILALSWLIE